MIFSSTGIVTAGAVAIGRIDVQRMHAAEVYVAPAIGELYGCRYWHNQAGSFFYGHWVDVEHAHALLAKVRSAMERDFRDFSEDGGGAENPSALVASFSAGMGERLSQRLRHLKAGRTARLLARARDAAAAPALLCRTALARTIGRHTVSGSTLAYAAGVEAGDRVALLGRRPSPSRPGRC
jgi:hypothetical protein